ncbi:response regulator transcription factor [Janthinobacterium lividum]|jgi:two-component system capsular synthesis response regulator RcsB|uniref:response regulator transcription factor n=1 Tax=Janthinobacterium lividum TaxID=29581 RepID=UPI000874B4D2|nr:response regulator transcription factor [Janthinobacterium lividum]MCC7716984.1 response regulator transcription factor [Janthinobacterium lividum]OEZ53444.1 transcriptional regulatory protein RcsB [Janthinobacterium lividum]WQE31933.1 response regulator transcription factor [Janthinobacterium lividum]STS86204.1 Capsular synthesis regulator component B [Janthinobacterium lividum]
MKRLRIALLDDHAVVRHGLVNRFSTEHDIEVVGAYSTSRELIAGLQVTPADILLLDYALSPNELDGVSLIRALRVKFPDCPILILSTHHEPATVALALRVGARGFVGKGDEMVELIKALRTVASGAVYLSADMSYRVAEATITHHADTDTSDAETLLGAALSAREREVIRCYLHGMTVTEIAEKFKRSIKTISSQKASAFRKLGVTSNNELFKIRHTIGES